MESSAKSGRWLNFFTATMARIERVKARESANNLFERGSVGIERQTRRSSALKIEGSINVMNLIPRTGKGLTLKGSHVFLPMNSIYGVQPDVLPLKGSVDNQA
jgi:hypothetical protein